MYPCLRLAREIAAARRARPLGIFDTHASTHRIWPWDLDPWRELNNGRTLTLYDLGRVPLAIRVGLTGILRERGWGFTAAGNTVRYRKRIRLFERITQCSRLLGWDERFFYMEQSMWRAGECCNHMLVRVAIVGGAERAGLVPPRELLPLLNHPGPSPDLPAWVKAWIAADALRPWPPAIDAPSADRTNDLPA